MTVFVDLETRSHRDLRVCGGRVYAQDPSTEILCAVLKRAGETVVWVPGWRPKKEFQESYFLPKEPLIPVGQVRFFFGRVRPPKILASWAEEPWIAHNAWGFDEHVWATKVPKSFRPPSWVDSMRLAKRAALPSGLDAIGNYLFGVGKHKGKAVLQKLCAPHKKTGAFIPLNQRNLGSVVAYCIQDVLLLQKAWEDEINFVEHAADDHVLAADYSINNRGASLDDRLSREIISLELGARQKRGEEIEQLTEGQVTRALLRSPKKFRAWVKDTFDVDLPNLQRGTVIELLDEAPDTHPTLRLALEARLGETRITSSKLIRALDALSEDERMRDLLFYHSAHTGRWGGRRFQPQNLPAQGLAPGQVLDCISSLLEEPKAGSDGKGGGAGGPLEPDGGQGDSSLRLESGSEGRVKVRPSDEGVLSGRVARFLASLPRGVSISDGLGSMVRACVLAVEGFILGIPDFAAIEARGLAWIVEDQVRLREFRDDLDPYKAFAARALGKPYSEVTKAERKLFKPPVLGAGYQIGGPKLETYAAGMGVNLKEYGTSGQELVELWRDHNPLVAGTRTGDEFYGVQMRTGGIWRDLTSASFEVVDGGGPLSIARCQMEMRRGHFILTLPSGKEIYYRNARIEPVEPSWGGKPRDTFTFDRPKQGGMIRASQYGGKWVENIVQAICTGCGGLLGEAIARIEKRFPGRAEIILHVHDELIWEQRPDEALFLDVLATMIEVPDWAKGFPIKASGFMSTRYLKEAPKKTPEFSLRDDGFGGIVFHKEVEE